MTATIDELLQANGYVVADGAMGTQLFAVGLSAGDPPEAWNVHHTEEVRAIHRAYLQAGADLVVTNSFGGTSFRLALHGLQDQVVELNAAAARNARVEADAEMERAGRRLLVAGSMGPTGELLEPLGNMSAAACEAGFAEQAEGLAAGGADVLWIETMSDLDEVEAAVRGARSACDLPVAASMSFDTAGRTMMGVTGSELAERLGSLGLAAMGANCGNNIADTEAAVISMTAASTGTPVISKPNAGVPVWSGDALVYDGTPEVLAAHAHRARGAGVAVIGSCCGSTPAHTAKIAAVLAGDEPPPDIDSAPPSTSATEDRMARRRTRRRRS
ncbi:MAG: betaine--homocysteine S-methyltransferase [Acidimicrobiaceae bacterium]|nr:betaine--homocysteine S-methyltransferase [Acidimicrobiaceae bacterium]MDE0514917.1 betaine--homocysteine S-methyltransferase [Acidimicrobiaceae bacterium]MDE0657168.1 betaine--homocysteine S-methyltransferase [Acidimicrobiaceae bacterium]